MRSRRGDPDRVLHGGTGKQRAPLDTPGDRDERVAPAAGLHLSAQLGDAEGAYGLARGASFTLQRFDIA